jgi:hypothetical protein
LPLDSEANSKEAKVRGAVRLTEGIVTKPRIRKPLSGDQKSMEIDYV